MGDYSTHDYRRYDWSRGHNMRSRRSVPAELRRNSNPTPPRRKATSRSSHSSSKRNRFRPLGQSSSKRYRFRPLGDPKHQIRLLRIRWVQNDLCGQLGIYNDNDLVSYKALSYTRGDSRTDKHRILLSSVDGRGRRHVAKGYLAITRSLYELLVQIAPHSSWSGWLWTDAICIDQKGNPTEKTYQLRKMKEIYENAHDVFAWLGPGTRDSNRGMKAIKQMYRVQSAEAMHEFLAYSKRRPRWSWSSGSTFRHDDFSKWFEKHSIGVTDIFKRRYWTRMWILQELAVTRKSATIACGKHCISWSRFVDIAMRIASCDVLSRRFNLQHHVWLLAQIYKRDSRQLCMSKVIYLTHNAECENVTDTVHAILGLVTMGHGTKLRLNSDDSAQTVLYRTIRCMQSDLELLALNDQSAWGGKLERWRRQAAWIRDKRQSDCRQHSRYITEREAIWEECEEAESGLNLCHQLAKICHEREVLYKYCSPEGVRFDCTLTTVYRVRRARQ
ncbi:heterokaryon incompatibility protein-domain-containing protein [Phaeosphaeria sp. MPI-PUGE-AT-0046c]|nr:heterokaryon incompatibility protein-domain-containing protein [Phaeosphaeria sp. MPI-PUGE-AT-0046c]